ncbi:TRAP transporter large permease [bacterium]|nr:TRAP transporter large permease [bacterium]
MVAASFFILVALGVPIAFSIGIATFLTAITQFDAKMVVILICQDLVEGPNSFVLLCIPFFVFSGLLMGRGGIARRLVDFANALVGRFRGGLGYVNVLACMFFGAISGSAAAATSSIGTALIPEMRKEGYDREFSAALTMTAATTGLLIPPSNIMIVYAAVSAVSIQDMFLAGFIPGIVVGLCLMTASGTISIRRRYPKADSVSLKETLVRFKRAILSLMLIVIVLGGIVAGKFTPTEAAAIAVLYSFFLSVILYRQVKLADLPGIMLETGVITAFIMFLIGASKAMGWTLTDQQIPERLATMLLGISDNKWVILLIVNAFLLAVGAFMDMTPAVLIFTPIFLPVARSLGIDDLHFGIIMIANLCIGLVTPPVGTILFVGCAVAETTVSRVFRSLLPFFIAMIVALAIIAVLPTEWVVWLPKLFAKTGG